MSCNKALLASVAALFLATGTAHAEKMTMLCGDLEVLVIVTRPPGKPNVYEKVDIYPADSNSKLTTDMDSYVRAGELYINDKKCIVKMYWICPADERTC